MPGPTYGANLRLGYLGKATMTNNVVNDETKLGADCAGETTAGDNVQMSSFYSTIIPMNNFNAALTVNAGWNGPTWIYGEHGTYTNKIQYAWTWYGSRFINRVASKSANFTWSDSTLDGFTFGSNQDWTANYTISVNYSDTGAVTCTFDDGYGESRMLRKTGLSVQTMWVP